MINLRDLTIDEMEKFVLNLGEPKFRAKQVFGWIYKGKKDFREMSNLPEAFRIKLNDNANIENLTILDVEKSQTDGTRKYLFKLNDENVIESVFMKYKYGNSICVSSQAGCRMGCKFCASTLLGLSRNLTPGEIVSQVMMAEEETGDKINHIVVMGTGEPFDNYENLSSFIKIVNDKRGLNIGMRNITVSTCGVIPMIEKFSKDFPQVNLAISLHSSRDEVRSLMMPINKKYSISELIRACQEYTETTNRRITFEYTLVKDKNDSTSDALHLASLLKGMLCHVNLIPLNKVSETGLDTSSKTNAIKFQEILESQGIPTTIRRELGADISAACGQLRLKNRRIEEYSK